MILYWIYTQESPYVWILTALSSALLVSLKDSIQKGLNGLWNQFLNRISACLVMDTREGTHTKTMIRHLTRIGTFDKCKHSKVLWDYHSDGHLLFISERSTYMWIEGKLAHISLTSHEDKIGYGYKNLSIRIFFTELDWAKDWFRSTLEEIKKNEEQASLWMNMGGEWNYFGKLRERPIHTVNLPGNMKESLIEDLQTFGEAEDKYRERGIPYRRGYLFYGLPGTGKTSCALALAQHLKKDIRYLSLSSGITDKDLTNLIRRCGDDDILLIEDVDAATKAVQARVETTPEKSEEDTVEAAKTVTLSGVLNAIDGVMTPDGLVVILTTNHYDRLDPALLRKGRIDVHTEFPYATADVAEAIIQRVSIVPHAIMGPIIDHIQTHGPIAPASVQEAAIICQTAEEARMYLRNELNSHNEGA